MNTRIIYIIFFLVLVRMADGQEKQNLIPNPGFESFSAYPVGWFYTGKHFSNVVKYWSSPTAASPDAYGPNIFVPTFWKDKGFGMADPHSGAAMAGITVYGCQDGKPHCREYIQAPLIEPLVVGQRYGFSMWIRKLESGFDIKSFGVSFTFDKTYIDNDKPLTISPIFPFDQSTQNSNDNWIKIEGEFIAKQVKDFMVIGNFENDSSTDVVSQDSPKLTYGYYYVDDVQLNKLEPILPVPEKITSWEKVEILEGHIYRLNNIYFDTDKAELLPKSFVELDKLAALMRKYPNMVIEIDGHTDNQGNKTYNHILSVNRAKAVVDYLNESGIESIRTMSKGFGKSVPIASNETPSGRQLNRRVEFRVIKL